MSTFDLGREPMRPFDLLSYHYAVNSAAAELHDQGGARLPRSDGFDGLSTIAPPEGRVLYWDRDFND